MSSLLGRSKITALVAEFMGTAILSMAVLSMVIRTPFPFFAAMTAGLTVAVLILILGSASGAHYNPAVTIGLWTMKKVQTTQALVFVASQLLGGLVGWKFAELLLDTKLDHIASWGLDRRVLFAEILGTFVFTFGVAAAVNGLYEGKKLALTIGGSLSLGIVVASLGSNGLLNPAVAIGVNSISWAYMLGPLLGGILGMSTYNLMFATKSSKKSKKVSRK